MGRQRQRRGIVQGPASYAEVPPRLMTGVAVPLRLLCVENGCQRMQI
jgi:hypothetical protein